MKMRRTFDEALHHLLSEESLKAAWLYGLSTIGPQDYETFKQAWPRISAARRRKVMQRLVELAEANFEVDFKPIFLHGLADEDPEVRVAAIEGLWEHEDAALIAPLVHLLRADPELQVRAAAATAMGQFVLLGELEKIDGAAALLAEQSLLETIRHPDEDIEVRRRAVEAVGYSSKVGIRNVIEAAYFDDHPRMRVSALFAMGNSADMFWIPTLLRELENDDPEFRFHAAHACGRLEAAETVHPLIALIERETDYEVQGAAIWSLGRIGGSTALRALETLAEDEDEVVREVAQEALDEINLLAGLDLPIYDLEADDEDDFLADLTFDDEDNDYLN